MNYHRLAEKFEEGCISSQIFDIIIKRQTSDGFRFKSNAE